MGGTAVTCRTTARADGDFRIDGVPGALSERRAQLAPHPWTWLRQVHGSQVVVVTEPGEHAGARADAAVTAAPQAVLAVHTADCAPIVVWDDGAEAFGVIHAGWRGLLAGVVESAVTALRDLSSGPWRARVGPCIRVGCYEFGEADLAPLVDRFGAEVGGTTLWGTPAFDLPAAVALALQEAGVGEVHHTGGCTACDRRWFSHRAGREVERMATVAWLA